MNNIFKFTLIAAIFLSAFSNVTAQKVGYFNDTDVFADMPEVKAMRSQLESLQTQLQKQLQVKVEDMQKIQTEARTKKEAGTLTPLEENSILEDLQKRQTELQQMNQDMQQKLVDKEEALLKPILEKVNTAIEAIAKEKGYSYILNASVLLYTDGTNDITPLVKAKL